MNGSLFSITRYMNGVCFKVSGGTSVPKLPPSNTPPPSLRIVLDLSLLSIIAPIFSMHPLFRYLFVILFHGIGLIHGSLHAHVCTF